MRDMYNFIYSAYQKKTMNYTITGEKALLKDVYLMLTED